MLVRCHIARSTIEGLGVHASEPVAAGAVVWRLDPRYDIIVRLEDLAKAPAPVQEFYERYAYEVESFPGHMALDGDDGRFMNHCSTPNLDFSTPGIATAVRDIAAGEELTCDYHLLASRPFEMQGPRNRV